MANLFMSDYLPCGFMIYDLSTQPATRNPKHSKIFPLHPKPKHPFSVKLALYTYFL